MIKLFFMVNIIFGLTCCSGSGYQSEEISALANLSNTKIDSIHYSNSLNLPHNESPELKGKYTLIDIWAYWCSPCLESIPKLTNLLNRYGDKDFQIIGLTRFFEQDAEGREKELTEIEKISSRFDIGYPILIDDSNWSFDTFEVSLIPTFVLLNNEGMVVDYGIGYEGFDKLSIKLDKMFLK